MDREIDIATRRSRTATRAVTGIAVVAGVAALLAILPGWLSPTLNRQRLRTAVVERGRIEATVEAAGTAHPAFENVLSSPIEATVRRIVLRPGARVEPGDILLELDTAAARLELDRLEEQLAQKQNEQRQVRLALENTLASLEARTETGKLDVEILGIRVQQNRSMHEQQLISSATLRESEVEAQKAAILLRQYQESTDRERLSAEAQIDGLALDIGIARKEVLKSRRTVVTDRHVFADELLGRIAAAYQGMADELDTRRQALRDCVGGIDGRARRALDLRYAEGLKPAAVARQMEMTGGAVRVLLHRVRSALRDCIRRRLKEAATT